VNWGFERENGFTLIEILVVLSLMGLIATMLPKGLIQLYEGSGHRGLVQKTLGAVRACLLLVQQQQKSERLGSPVCSLPAQLDGVEHTALMPIFHANGTASHTAHIVVESEVGEQLKRSVIIIDKLTASARVQIDAEPQ
jgi:prepilin-type N-terminal cleavage/methylation domain-containing protein